LRSGVLEPDRSHKRNLNKFPATRSDLPA
jgi:hypothetical protein